MERQIDRKTKKQVETARQIQMDRKICRWTNKQTDRHMDRQRDGKSE